ncbi:hypothetical protein Deipr_0990 [Deinococcus proteolyticus MRP]|uniref:Uncharacterized protein n=1 Tax=Deinococcus proteolyticus (strain ATCC 35074 / DSM 20540 / JCM 6276 / NBRC 101906 / NCIMB 13154 / VKM Ac-1939 / CCM 2703 / MRP) TaxID=693977 RepID=F0RN04_DEIPM|nr:MULTISPECIES: hypothetical protein [Deinococcus]ADY26146.1 hypothetical protein Deipr_0990 [Deinococcus proteolyticus MRP]MCY1702266.1 hypothetical protein [Deinococcus sp. SL84]
MPAEYLTLLADPSEEWWAGLEAQAAGAGVSLQRQTGQSAGQFCWRLTLQGEAAAVEEVRNWAVRRCWQDGLRAFTV